MVNDGSDDETLERLRREFRLQPVPDVYREQLPTARVHRIYRSETHPNLRVLDRDNGGKADALNAGVNSARYPLVCGIDADSMLERESLRRVVLPFIEDSRTVAVGGTVRIANGCDVRDGFVTRPGLPRNPVALFQIVEYLRAFLFGRMGWARINSLMVISGAFGLFHRGKVVEVGGYDTETVGEDMELTMRLHHHLRERGEAYRITFVPEPICWTEVPTDLRTLKNQRIRWQRGLSESLMAHRGLLFERGGGAVSWIGFPFIILVEWFAPVVEVIGYLYMTVGFLLGFVDAQVMAIFLTVAIGFGTLLSLMGLLLEELSLSVYTRPREIVVLFVAAVLENFGYRQLVSAFRLMGIFRWLVGAGKGEWGEMRRTGAGSGNGRAVEPERA